MTAVTITDVMLPSFATILHELAFQIETVVFRICGTASGMDLHGSPHLDIKEMGFLAIRFRFGESACRNSLPPVYSESTLGKGGASDTGMCRTSYCFVEERIEKSRLTPPNPKYTPTVSSKRLYRPSQAGIVEN